MTHASAMPFHRCAELPNIRKIVQIGMRGVRNTRQDYEAAVANGNVIITARELHEQGVAASLERALPFDNVYFSIDIDGMDVSIAPGCGGQEPGGATAARHWPHRKLEPAVRQAGASRR